ncbi:helix-turn-helix domain-containing protein [Hydrocoleum sp. CS-953]|uniref:helix-turn-helix domain-containing protein n=1 Tax=Hydrocoleum sp. CS-953 TaxID=1671698 RepID=UPI001FEF9DC1|nr:helix-turn-helix domain-containing protein [Hydrocoleum sp. CS-953]
MSIKKSKINQDKSETNNQQITSLSFTDVDLFTEFFGYGGMQMIQLTTGPLQSKFLSIRIGELHFIYNQANQGIQTWGLDLKKYRDFTMVWFENEGEFYSHRRPIEPQRTIFGFNGDEVDFLMPQGGTIANILIPVETFHAYANQLQRHDLDDCFLSKNYVNLLPTGMKEIKDYLKEIFWLAEHKPSYLQQDHVVDLVTNDFLPLLISNIPIKWNSKSSLKPSRQAKLIAQAEQEMLESFEEPLTLKQLAQNLESSSSALSRGFKDLFGMSAMRYLKVRRLNALRQRLKASDPENCTITMLAGQFGFWSAGHFARDYKAMFGELPSETLRKKA